MSGFKWFGLVSWHLVAVSVRNIKKMPVVLVMAAAFSVQAQDIVIAAMGTRTVLKAYADADGKSELPPLSVKDISFPLKIYETAASGFVHVKVAGQDVWLDRKQVRIPPESLTVSCITKDQANTKLVAAGVRGANSGCN
jgi:hypothetical protein